MKKNLIKVTIIMSMLLLTLIPLSVNAAIVGDGTEASPFMITNQAELELVTDFPSSHFKLANDIVMTEELKTPLCYESENQTFSGVFDGNGHTIFNLIINDEDFSLGYDTIALFKKNSGIIKNLNIEDADIFAADSAGIAENNSGSILNCTISAEIGGGPGHSYGIAESNSGTISECTISGNLRGACDSVGIVDDNIGTISKCSVDAQLSGACMVGIAKTNNGIIEECEFVGTIPNSWVCTQFYGITIINGTSDNTAGGANAIISKCKVACDFHPEETASAYGICQTNYTTIKDCYFIGSLEADTVGGITHTNGAYGWSGGEEFVTYGKIENCYVASSFKNTTQTYPIASTEEYQKGIVLNCYYDRTLSGINDRTQGTPLSTVAMKLKQSYQNSFDFDTVWGIDENINDGYPYLLWEYPDEEIKNPYTVNNVKIKDFSGNVLEEIPDGSFYFEINVTKNDNSKKADCLIIAVYDENGAFIDLKYMSGTYYQNQTMTFGSMINKTDKKIGKIKAFVWDSVSGMQPLSNSMEITN